MSAHSLLHRVSGLAAPAALAALVVATGSLVAACNRPSPVTDCAPQCAGKTAGAPDGCSGVCPEPPAPVGCAACGPQDVCIDDACVCQPSCAGRASGGDGCGGTCACAPGEARDGAGACKPAKACGDTCKSEGFECGEICGAACGTCDASKSCIHGKCLCVPVCDGTRCDDGCGGTCACAGDAVCAPNGACVAKAACTGTCGAARSCGTVCGASCGTCADGQGCANGTCATRTTCEDCGLKLTLVSHVGKKVVVAIDYSADDAASDPRPRIAEFRVRGSKPFHVVTIAPGDALAASKKELSVPPGGAAPFRVRPDGTLQILVQSAADVMDLTNGRVATLELTAEAPDLQLWLVRREQVFAPPPSDGLLQSTRYDAAMTVKR